MADDERGRNLRLSTGRILVHELMRHSRHIPLVTVEKKFLIPETLAARTRSKISWVALFAKAYSMAGEQIPQLRQAWVPLPRPHLYEHPHSECAVIVEREFEGEMCVFTSAVRSPEATSLADITGHIRRFRDEPVWSVNGFRVLIRLAKLPAFMRWLMLFWYLGWTGRKKCKRFGTFAISSLGNYGAELLNPILPLTAYVTFGPISEAGEVNVRLIFDHRVMDGRHAARALVEMEKNLRKPLVEEMGQSATRESLL